MDYVVSIKLVKAKDFSHELTDKIIFSRPGPKLTNRVELQETLGRGETYETRFKSCDTAQKYVIKLHSELGTKILVTTNAYQ